MGLFSIGGFVLLAGVDNLVGEVRNHMYTIGRRVLTAAMHLLMCFCNGFFATVSVMIGITTKR